MKLILLFLTFSFCSISLYCQQPTVKFYTSNDVVKSYNISEIQSINIAKFKDGYEMEVYYSGLLQESYATTIIDSIQFIIINDLLSMQIIHIDGSYFKSLPLKDIDSVVFRPIIYPIILEVNPVSGKVGDTITIKGKNFGETQELSCVYVTYTIAANYISWSDTLIKIIIPPKAISGKLSITVKDRRSNEVDFVVINPPIISSITPISVGAGEDITIEGNNFGSTQGNGIITFNDINATIIRSWSNIQIICKVPTKATSGKLFITKDSIKSNEVDYNIILHPKITSLIPKSFQVGDEVIIVGENFDKQQNNSVLLFNNVASAEIIGWTNTEIKCKVPTITSSGTLSLTVTGQQSNEVDFTLLIPPVISSISKTTLLIGDELVIHGNNFGYTKSEGSISFNNVICNVITSWTNNKIVCKVPDETFSGKLVISVNDLKSNQFDYRIFYPIEFVLIPTGTFMMGNTGSFFGGETPVHKVTISKEFYMSKYEITQPLYSDLMGKNPSAFRGFDLPVDQVTWLNACEFCNRLSERDGFNKCYTINGTDVSCDWTANGYRLPTEAEWEYACKAGTTTDFYSGESENNLADIAWYSANSNNVTHTPGLKQPNSFGLYDITGNVWEWVWDWMGNYSADEVTDPKGPVTGGTKVLRGGSWHNGLNLNRSSIRGADMPGGTSSTDGLRVIRVK